MTEPETALTAVRDRVRAARRRRDLPLALREQTALVARSRERAAPLLDRPVESLSDDEWYLVGWSAMDEYVLGEVLREQDDPACADHLGTAHDLFLRIGDHSRRSAAAHALGNAFLFVPGLVDLDEAEEWFFRSLRSAPEDDVTGQAQAYLSLGSVAFNRLCAALDAGVPARELGEQIARAGGGFDRAVALLPADDHVNRAVAENQSGALFHRLGDVPRALRYLRRAVDHREAAGDAYGAATARFNIAVVLLDDGHPADALPDARAALATLRELGPGVAEVTARAERLVRDLERRIPDVTDDEVHAALDEQ